MLIIKTEMVKIQDKTVSGETPIPA